MLAGTWAHIPSTRKKKSDLIPRSLTIPRLSVDIYSIHKVSVSKIIVPYSTNLDKRSRFYAIFSCMTNIFSSPKNSYLLALIILSPLSI